MSNITWCQKKKQKGLTQNRLRYRKTSSLTQGSLSKRKKKANEQSMTQAKTQAAIEVIMVVRKADNLVNNATLIHGMPRSSGPALIQPSFH